MPRRDWNNVEIEFLIMVMNFPQIVKEKLLPQIRGKCDFYTFLPAEVSVKIGQNTFFWKKVKQNPDPASTNRLSKQASSLQTFLGSVKTSIENRIELTYLFPFSLYLKNVSHICNNLTHCFTRSCWQNERKADGVFSAGIIKHSLRTHGSMSD